jgi:hypothetical protein
MKVNEYVNEIFPNLKLRPPLFYNWNVGIRFQLGDPAEVDSEWYMERVYFRAVTLFKALHAREDDMLIVANVHHIGAEQQIFRRRKVKIFSRHITSKKVLYRLQHQVIPCNSEEADDTYEVETHRYWLRCKVKDIRYIHLLRAICNQDMGIIPKIDHDVFFVNLSRGTIFHVYDDRGCDVIATAKQTIRPLYEMFNDWILAYDKKAIDRVFQ